MRATIYKCNLVTIWVFGQTLSMKCIAGNHSTIDQTKSIGSNVHYITQLL